MSNLSKRLEHFLNIEAESRVVYHRRAEEDKVDDSHASTTNQEAAERFTRALPLRKNGRGLDAVHAVGNS